MKPLAVDLFCGVGGFSTGAMLEGYDCIGFDIERHVYGSHRYPAQLVVQDILTLHGSQFKTAAMIWASPPCQFFSYCAMPWSRAKALAAAVRADPVRLEKELALFNACFRIQREASEAAGHHVPMVVENVRGAQPWVGRARWNFGSFYLFGDVPALMPITAKAIKVPTMGAGWYPPGHPKHVKGLGFNTHASRNLGRRTDPGKGARFTSRDCGIEVLKEDGSPHHKLMPVPDDGRKGVGSGSAWFYGNQGQYSSKSSARKMASAMIAKIPLPLSRWVAATYFPKVQK